MPPKTRLKKPATPRTVPQSRDQVADAIAALGQLDRDLKRIGADMNDELAAVKARFEAAAEPLRKNMEDLTAGVQVWCEAHRETLTQGGKVKTATFTTGEVAWRTRPPSVTVRGAEAVLAALRKLGLKRFIREKAEVNKEAILNEPQAIAAVPGISISQGEDFAVTPFELPLQAVA